MYKDLIITSTLPYLKIVSHYAIRIMVYVLDSLSLLVEYFLLAANPRSDAYPRIVVYPYSDTGMVISSPTSIAKTLALKLVFLSIFISFVCWYVQIYNK